MPRGLSDLELHLGYWLRFVSNHVSHAFRLKVEAHDVTVAEWVILRSLFDVRAVNPSWLADTLGMTRGAISKLVDRLAAKRLVRRRPDTTDRRSHTVCLSATGRKLVPVLAGLADANDEEFFGALSERDRARLFVVLKGIVRDRGLKTVPVE